MKGPLTNIFPVWRESPIPGNPGSQCSLRVSPAPMERGRWAVSVSTLRKVCGVVAISGTFILQLTLDIG